MRQPILDPDDIDHLFRWPPGRAARLARRGKLPHYRLPDGSLRFMREEIERSIVHVPAASEAEGE